MSTSPRFRRRFCEALVCNNTSVNRSMFKFPEKPERSVFTALRFGIPSIISDHHLMIIIPKTLDEMHCMLNSWITGTYMISRWIITRPKTTKLNTTLYNQIFTLLNNCKVLANSWQMKNLNFKHNLHFWQKYEFLRIDYKNLKKFWG